jgi:hypothetical protein
VALRGEYATASNGAGMGYRTVPLFYLGDGGRPTEKKTAKNRHAAKKHIRLTDAAASLKVSMFAATLEIGGRQ